MFIGEFISIKKLVLNRCDDVMQFFNLINRKKLISWPAGCQVLVGRPTLALWAPFWFLVIRTLLY